MSRARKQAAKKKDLAREAYEAGLALVRANPALGSVRVLAPAGARTATSRPATDWCASDSDGVLHAHPTRRAEPAEWAWAIAHGLIHLGFGHVPAAKGERVQPDRYDIAARCVVVNRFLLGFPVGTAPEHLPTRLPRRRRGAARRPLAARGLGPGRVRALRYGGQQARPMARTVRQVGPVGPRLAARLRVTP